MSTDYYVSPENYSNVITKIYTPKKNAYTLSFLKDPPYFVRFPKSSMISGIAEAKRARPTVRKSTWKALPRVVMHEISP